MWTAAKPMLGACSSRRSRPWRADELVWLNAMRIDSMTLSFVNFKNELPFFIERVLPLLRRAACEIPEAAASLIVDTHGCFTPSQQCSCNSSTCPAS
jgi:hypothetical protein